MVSGEQVVRKFMVGINVNSTSYLNLCSLDQHNIPKVSHLMYSFR